MIWTPTRTGYTASGVKGTYQIRWVAGAYVLTATGWDDLPMSGLPPWGRQYMFMEQARACAAWLDSIHEWAVSGC